MVCPSVCVSSVTLVHPAKAAGRNEMPFGRDTRVVRSNVLLYRGSGHPREREIWGSEPAYCQTISALVILAKTIEMKHSILQCLRLESNSVQE